MKYVLALKIIPVISVTAAAMFAGNAHPQPSKAVSIKPGKIHEKCVELTPPQKIEYRFDSAAKLNFNLHFHKRDQVYYPVKLDSTNGESGLYEAKAKEVYCLMWENKTSADIDLSYNARVVN